MVIRTAVLPKRAGQDTHATDPCAADFILQMSTITVTSLNVEAEVTMFGRVKVPTCKSVGGASIHAFTAIAAAALHRFTRWQQGIG